MPELSSTIGAVRGHLSVAGTVGVSHQARQRAEELVALESWIAPGFDDDTPPEWQERALCAQTDPEAFFPEKGGSTREAKRICTGCEVRDECLEYALANDERFGIWGGLSERERRRLKRGILDVG